mgnify:CR=1 FL=1
MQKMSGEKKAAILLISLGPEIASQILKLLPDKLIQKVTYEIANMDYVEPKESDEIINEFLNMASAREYLLDGGIDYAKNLLHKALGSQKAKEVIDLLKRKNVHIFLTNSTKGKTIRYST